ncbi:MAG: mitochondrial glycoprotein [Benjaminiella poitrasii]|nr:MAG: mitochondrial glycoprotein [Benjaminiella poitrasii]
MFRRLSQHSSSLSTFITLRARHCLHHPSVIHQRLLSTSILRNKTLQTLPSIYQHRPFSTSWLCRTNGDVDPDLVHLLEEELQFEKSNDKDEPPAFIKEFLDTNLFQIDDKPHHDKVILSRTFGNEKINVIFSISDINKSVEEEMIQEKLNADDKEETNQEDEIIVEDDEDLEDISFPVRATVIIQKEGVKGTLVLNTVAQDGYMNINSVRFLKDAIDKDIVDIHNENPVEEKDLYMGPIFDDLNEDIRINFGRYLEERGIDTALATFLPDYVDYKEQKEYENWLNDVNTFISA